MYHVDPTQPYDDGMDESKRHDPDLRRTCLRDVTGHNLGLSEIVFDYYSTPVSFPSSSPVHALSIKRRGQLKRGARDGYSYLPPLVHLMLSGLGHPLAILLPASYRPSSPHFTLYLMCRHKIFIHHKCGHRITELTITCRNADCTSVIQDNVTTNKYGCILPGCAYYGQF